MSVVAGPELVVVEAGIATSIQDLGRPGWAHLGVTAGGALDPVLVGQLNRLVGNDERAAVLETAGGLVVAATTAVTVGVTPDVAVHHLGAGHTLRIDPQPDDVWGYLTVRGGIAVHPVLGSRSRDSRSGIGPAAPRAGDRLPVGPPPSAAVVVDQGAPPVRRHVLRVWEGPRHDWFAGDAWSTLTTTAWEVTADVSRVGVRLRGPALTRRRRGELASEGLVAGSVQVPGDGQPVVMLRDHPTTGGYPVIAVVDPADLPDLAQRRPGTTLRFRPADGPPVDVARTDPIRPVHAT